MKKKTLPVDVRRSKTSLLKFTITTGETGIEVKFMLVKFSQY